MGVCWLVASWRVILVTSTLYGIATEAIIELQLQTIKRTQ